MTSGTLQRGDSYSIRLAGKKGKQFRKEVESEVQRVWN
jgi:hypothetical protein